MTTLAELVAAPPDDDHGFATQLRYQGAPVRFAVEIADPLAGSSVVWHDITDYFITMHDERGSDEPHGKFKSSPTSMQFAARGDDLAPRNTDNSAKFGVHVPLRAGKIVRAGAFTASGETITNWWPLFTKQVEQWHAASIGIGQTLTHEVTLVDLHTELATHIVPAQTSEGWSSRVATTLVTVGMADWPFGYDIYGATAESDMSPLLTLPAIDEMSAIAAIDGATDPADIVWRPTRTGKLLFHPHPDDTWHSDQFGAGAEGEAWTNPLLSLYPNGVTFSHQATGDEVPILYPGQEGQGFDINSDIEGVVNHVQVSTSSGIVYDEDNPTSVSTYRQTRTKALSWLIANDDAADRIIATQAYADLQARPIRTSMSNPGAFPALALLDHLDPVTIKYQSFDTRPEWTGPALVRKISHDITKIDNQTLVWNSTTEVDIDAVSAFETDPLLPVENLAASNITETSFDVSYTNPTQPSTTPTHTQKRVTQLSLLWYDGQYPSTGGTRGGLEPDTLYTYEVRLVRIVDGITTHFSPVRSINVRTLPISVPSNPGPGGDGGDTTVTIPPPDSPECVLEWKLESTADNEASVPVWTLVDSGDQDDLTLNPDGTYSLTVDETVFEAGLLYRFASREVCDGTPGDWLYGAPFRHPGDWTADCTTPAALATEPYDDASLKAYVPQVCLGDQIYEAVTDTPAAKGDAFAGFLIGSGIDDIALAADGDGGLLAYGQAYTLFGLGDSPKTLGIRTKVATLETLPILMAGAGITVSIVASGSDFVFRAIAQLDAGDAAITATSTTALVLDQVYDVKVTFDPADGTLTLFDGTTQLATTSLSAAANLVQNTDAWYMGAVAAGWSTDFAVWGSVVAAAPLDAHDRVAAYLATVTGVELYVTGEGVSNGATMEDLSGNNRDGTWNTPNGPDDTMNGVTVADLQSTGGGVTPDVAAWDSVIAGFCAVEIDATTTAAFIDRDQEGAGNANRSWQFRTSGGKLQFIRVSGASGTTVETTAILSPATEYTVGWFYDSGTLRLYVDGSEVKTGAVGALGTGASPVAIGYHQGQSGNPANKSNLLNGRIGSVVLFSSGSWSISDLHDAWVGA